MHTKGPAQPNRSIQDGLECLWQLVAAGGPVGSREMARMLEIEPTRSNRLLGTLAAIGLAARTPERKYVPGPGIHVLAAMSLRGSRLLGAALPAMAALARKTDAGVALGVLWRRHVCYLYHGRPGGEPLLGIAGHNLYPADQSSIGKVLLSARPEREVRELLRAGPGTRTSHAALSRELDGIRRDGYAVNRDESMAVAIGNPPVGGLAVITVISDGNRAELLAALRAAARDIQKRMSEDA